MCAPILSKLLILYISLTVIVYGRAGSGGSSSNSRYYDKQVNVFNSDGDLPQLAYADIAANRGDTLLCLSTEDGCVVLCTPTGSNAPLLDRRVLDKISKVDDAGLWAAFAGLAGDGRALVRISRRVCANYRLQYNAPPTLRFLTKSIADTQHEATLSGSERPFGVNLLLFGFDQGAEMPQIFLSKASGHMSQWRAIAIGKNSHKAMTHLESRLVASAREKLVRRPANVLEAAEIALDVFKQSNMESSFSSSKENEDQKEEEGGDKVKQSPSKGKCDLYQLRKNERGEPAVSMVSGIDSVDALDSSWRIATSNVTKTIEISGGFSDSISPLRKVLLGGKAKRCLRAIASRLKTQSTLATINCGIDHGDDAFVNNLAQVLSARNLVQVKFVKADKRKECKEIGDVLAGRIPGSQVVQVVGHTVLLYMSNPSATSDIDALLSKELAKAPESAE